MVKINLEKELIKENKKLIVPKELLMVTEYDKHTDYTDDTVLDRMGLNKNLKEGRNIKDRVENMRKQTEGYNQERVFHISQIESICKKYHLKFLKTEFYNGTIDDNLAQKITTFELAHEKTCDKFNTRIIAPAKSFKLQAEPVDPLLFYEINSEYFYLIHKWGNDLNIFRRILPILASRRWAAIIISFLFTLPLALIPIENIYGLIYLVISPITFGCIWFHNSLAFDEKDMVRLAKRNRWDKEFKN